MDENRKSEIERVFTDLAEEITAINIANGWDIITPSSWDYESPHFVPSKLALIHSEISEALEAYRVDERAEFDEELADALIRILELSHGLGTNLAHEVCVKLEKNRQRGYRHGNKRV